jgi:predicted nucleotidyltransferase
VPDEASVRQWLEEFVGRLREAFGSRLVFVGHHGSWARGEAGADSDIDAMVVVDHIDADDLATFRHVIHAMPDGGKLASGLFNAIAELQARSPSEMMQYFYGCEVLHGSVEGIVPEPGVHDLLADVRFKALTNLMHARHYLLYPHDLAQKVHSLRYQFKESFYALQEWVLAREGTWYDRKDDLLRVLTDEDDRGVVIAARDWAHSEDDRRARAEYYVELLERWSRRMLARASGRQADADCP